MEDPKEEFEPLFDYSRMQPLGVVCLDDDSLDASPFFCSKRRKFVDLGAEKKAQVSNLKDVEVINCDDNDDEEDWMPPPPKNLVTSTKIHQDDDTLKALRLKKQELALFAQSAEEVVRAVEESVRKDLSASLQSPPGSVKTKPVELCHEREKLVISIQDKDGTKQFRVYMDDRFERIFKMYADRVKIDPARLVFCFDGDKVTPTATPHSLGMEENDIMEVHVKAC